MLSAERGVNIVAMTSPEHWHTRIGIGWAVTSTLQLSLIDVLLKWLIPNYPVLQIAFVRFSFAVLLLAIFLSRTSGWSSLRTRRLPALMGRSLLSLGSMICFTLALARMELADAIGVTFAGPLFMTLLSVPLLGERVGPHRWAALGVGFAGVLLMVRPGAGIVGSGAFYALGAAVFYSLTIISQRVLVRTESNLAIVTFNLIGCALAAALFMPFQWVTPTALDLGLLMALGLLTIGAQLALAQACRLTPVAVLAPFDFTIVVWAVPLGFVIWGDLPDAAVVAGAMVVAGSGVYILRREAPHRRARLAAQLPK